MKCPDCGNQMLNPNQCKVCLWEPLIKSDEKVKEPTKCKVCARLTRLGGSKTGGMICDDCRNKDESEWDWIDVKINQISRSNAERSDDIGKAYRVMLSEDASADLKKRAGKFLLSKHKIGV